MKITTYEECVRLVYHYLAKDDSHVRIVNLMTQDEVKRFKQNFGTSANLSWDVTRYCLKSDLPEVDRLWNDLAEAPKDKPVFLYGFTTILKVLGVEKLRRFLKDFLFVSRQGHTVLIAFQCRQWLQEIQDPKAERLIYSSDQPVLANPVITLRSPELPEKYGNAPINGLNRLPLQTEESEKNNFVVITERTSKDFPNSLFLLNDENSFYDETCRADHALSIIREECGSEEYWSRLLGDITENGNSFSRLIENRIGTPGNLALSMDHWNSFDGYYRWLYFIALKLYGAAGNWCLQTASEKADSPEKLVREIYRSILSLSPSDKDFRAKYAVRRKLLSSLDPENHDAQDFTLLIRSREKEGLFFLSDGSIFEKEMVFELLDRYGGSYSVEELREILGFVYPDLLNYLQDYPLNDPLFDRYFSLYKYQKVINKLVPEFEALVEEQAVQHDFILKLPSRAEILDRIDFDRSEVFFMDAMGTEYLGFIAARCRDLSLRMRMKLCKAELPSDTPHNKGFVAELKNNGIPVYENDELDKLKHGKNKAYDYSLTKLPIHMLKEFDILATVVRQTSKKLSTNEIRTIYLIPDHGSSRPAMIKQDPQIIAMETAGEHGGRNCAWHTGMPQMERAVIEDNTYCMANYDRFKGSHISGVELHGGAAIEEVVIPVIAIELQKVSYEITLLTPVVSVSFKKKGEIRFSSNVHLENVQVRFEGELLPAEPDGENRFKASFTKKPKPGNYSIDVLADGSIAAENLSVTIQNEAAKERDLF